MKIEADRLRTLRKSKRLTRQQLANKSGISARTIQRLENEPERCLNTREDTVNPGKSAASTKGGTVESRQCIAAMAARGAGIYS